MRALGVLGAVAALLAAYLLFFDHAPRESSSEDQKPLLLGAPRGSAKRLTIARAGQPPIDLSRSDGPGDDNWSVTGQPGQPASARAVQDLLAELSRAQIQRTTAASPADAGLSPPAVTLWIYHAREAFSQVRLGRPDASGQGVFAQRGEGEPVVVVPRRLATLALESEFLDRRLFPLAPDAITHVAWQVGTDDPQHEWDRVEGRWKNAGGQRLNGDRVESTLRRLAELQPAAPAASVPGGGRIELRDRSGKTLRVSADRIPEPARDDLWRALAAADKADLRLLPTPPDRVRRIELADGPRRLVLVRETGDRAWRFADDAAHDVEQSAVAEWLAGLAKMDVQFPARSGRRLIVDGADAVTVGPADPAYAELDPDPRRFQSRRVLDFAHFDARELRRISAAGTLDARSADGETWSCTPPADSAAVARVVTALGNLQAAAWLPRPPASRPDLVLEISVQPPGAPVPVRHTVKLWPGCEGEMENAGAFRVAQALCADLRLDPASAVRR